MFTTLTVTALPTTRTDGSPLAPTDLGGANIYKNGVKYASLASPLAVGATFTDSVAAANNDSYTVTVFDNQTPPAESAQSNAYVVSVAVVLAPPGAPTISGVTA